MNTRLHPILPAVLVCALLTHAAHAQCPLPDPSKSYYVVQSGPVATPVEGPLAIRFLRACPDNDGGSSLPQSVRIKVVLLDSGGLPLTGVLEDQVYVLFNGGTPAQGFSGIGADSVIANVMWNPSPPCPDVRTMKADAPTDASGSTYITFGGGDPASPGSYLRNPNLKWGHFDSEIPVYVGLPPCNPIKLKGKLTSTSAIGTFTLQIKNTDVVGGLGAVLNQGERVISTDFNTCTACLTAPGGMFCFWCDLDWSGTVATADINILSNHITHNCQSPLSP